MEVMVTGRQLGKTTEAIRRVRDNPEAVLVVSTAQQALDLQRQHPDLRDRVVSATNIRTLMGRASIRTMIVDDAEAVLASLLGFPVSFATVTGSKKTVHESGGVEEELIEGVSEVYNSVFELTGDPDVAYHASKEIANHYRMRWYAEEAL